MSKTVAISMAVLAGALSDIEKAKLSLTAISRTNYSLYHRQRRQLSDIRNQLLGGVDPEVRELLSPEDSVSKDRISPEEERKQNGNTNGGLGGTTSLAGSAGAEADGGLAELADPEQGTDLKASAAGEGESDSSGEATSANVPSTSEPVGQAKDGQASGRKAPSALAKLGGKK